MGRGGTYHSPFHLLRVHARSSKYMFVTATSMEVTAVAMIAELKVAVYLA